MPQPRPAPAPCTPASGCVNSPAPVLGTLAEPGPGSQPRWWRGAWGGGALKLECGALPRQGHRVPEPTAGSPRASAAPAQRVFLSLLRVSTRAPGPLGAKQGRASTPQVLSRDTRKHPAQPHSAWHALTRHPLRRGLLWDWGRRRANTSRASAPGSPESSRGDRCRSHHEI